MSRYRTGRASGCRRTGTPSRRSPDASVYRSPGSAPSAPRTDRAGTSPRSEWRRRRGNWRFGRRACIEGTVPSAKGRHFHAWHSASTPPAIAPSGFTVRRRRKNFPNSPSPTTSLMAGRQAGLQLILAPRYTDRSFVLVRARSEGGSILTKSETVFRRLSQKCKWGLKSFKANGSRGQTGGLESPCIHSVEEVSWVRSETFLKKQLGLKAHTVTRVQQTEKFMVVHIDRLGARLLRCRVCRQRCWMEADN